MVSQPISQVDRAECHKPILLTVAKTNERGQAVHEDCYDRSIKAELAERTKAS